MTLVDKEQVKKIQEEAMAGVLGALKVGDVVRIRSLAWYHANKDSCGLVHTKSWAFTSYMSRFCGRLTRVMQVVSAGRYLLAIDGGVFMWTSEMFELPSVDSVPNSADSVPNSADSVPESVDSVPESVTPEVGDLKPAPPDWQRLYTTYCGMAMQGLLASGAAKWSYAHLEVASASRKFATAVVRQLMLEWGDDKGFDL